MNNTNAIDQSFETYLEQKIERMRNAVIYNLSVVGEKCINEARQSGNYTDQTGNLRSSIGYVIADNGVVISVGGFDGKGTTGSKEGRELADELVKSYSSNIVLIVVAGMEYASHVSAKGYDVLDSAELIAKKEVPKLLKQLRLN